MDHHIHHQCVFSAHRCEPLHDHRPHVHGPVAFCSLLCCFEQSVTACNHRRIVEKEHWLEDGEWHCCRHLFIEKQMEIQFDCAARTLLHRRCDAEQHAVARQQRFAAAGRLCKMDQVREETLSWLAR